MNELEVRFIEVGRTPIMRHYFTVECRTANGGEFNLPVETQNGQAIFELGQACKNVKENGEIVSAIVVTRRMRRGHLRARLHHIDGYAFVNGKRVHIERLIA